jgi:site-specific recombinase XerD
MSETTLLILQTDATIALPPLILKAGEHTSRRFIEFFLVGIRNPNTRGAYAVALRHFLTWCDDRAIDFEAISSLTIAAYIERHSGSIPTIKQHLSAIKSLFEWMVKGNVVEANPAREVKTLKYKLLVGKTTVLTTDEMKQLLEAIDTSSIVGLRDRALIATMFYSFARISAVLAMDIKDYQQRGKRSWLRLHEKGGRYHELPVHHKAELYLDEYLTVSGIGDENDSPLWRTTVGRSRKLTERRLQRSEAWNMVKRRARDAQVSEDVCNHSFRATGITNYLENGGSRDNAQRIAAHSDVRTTALYDRRGDEIALEEIERIRL